MFFEGEIDDEKYNGHLYGLGPSFTSGSNLPPASSGGTGGGPVSNAPISGVVNNSAVSSQSD